MELLARSWSRLVGLAWALAVSGFGAEPKSLEPQPAVGFLQRSWDYEHGLPTDNRIFAITETPDGYVWIGSQKGLARFDGLTFTVFGRNDTPERVPVDCRTLAADLEGNLWIGTQQELLRKSGAEFKALTDKLGAHFMPSPPLCASRSGGMWVGATGAVCRIHNDTVTPYSPSAKKSQSTGWVTSLKETEDGFLWIGTTTGLERLDIRTGTYEVGDDPYPVFAMWAAPGGQLWIVFWEFLPSPAEPPPRKWLACVEKGQWKRAAICREVLLDSTWQGRFLVGSGNALWLPAPVVGGIHRYENRQLELLAMPQEGEDDRPLTAFVDRESNLWVGMDKTGLQCWSRQQIRTFTVNDGLAHENVWSICERSDGGLLVGTEGGVTQFKDGKASRLTRTDGSAFREVRAVAQDLEGAIWIGTRQSLECIRDGTNRLIKLPGEWYESKIRALQPGRDGSMWVGTARGLTRLYKDERTKYTTNEVLAILESRSGELWAGILGGGLSRLLNGRLMTRLTTTNGLCSNNVWALHEDSDGILWIGTDNGLSCFHNGVLTTYTKANGLPENLVNFIISDKFGRLWVGHDRGIYALNKRQLQEVSKKPGTMISAALYDDSDGLLSIETNGQKSNPTACRTRDGRLWFPTTKGLAMLEPDKIATNEVAPLAALEEVLANGKPVAGQDLQLGPGGARVLEFRYTANTFVAPEKARFKYRVRGIDDQWIDAGTRREAYFTEIRPGKYRFEVIAGSHRGIWQQNGASVAFHVAPFYYETWWFYTTCGASVALLVGLAVTWRVRYLRRIHQLQRVNALNEQRRQIARDIHDELGASLTHIMRLSERAQMIGAQSDTTKGSFERITSIAGEAVDNIGEIVWANNPEYDTLEDLAAYLREHAASFFADTSIQVRFDFPESVPLLPVTGLFRRHVVLLMKEALQNVYKHARARHVSVRLALREGLLELSVLDDGHGFDADQPRYRGNGLVNMRQRVSELKGTLKISSRVGQGTEVQVLLPIPQIAKQQA